MNADPTTRRIKRNMSPKIFYKLNPDNIVPLSRTPWAGERISRLKSLYLNKYSFPTRIGETWEVSTDLNFPSRILSEDSSELLLSDLIARDGSRVLGKNVVSRYGHHCPLLLKWLHANDLLSVQVHPSHGFGSLSPTECGKPEAWLILGVEQRAFVFLGFKEGLTEDEIKQHLTNDEPEKCLHKYYPKLHDYISIPPGCIHAVGPGIFFAEPQYILAGKSGKTLRVSDWRRKFNARGEVCETGSFRELHLEEGLKSIDWTLPRGAELEKRLIRNLADQSKFSGNLDSPFAVEIFMRPGNTVFQPPARDQFSILTVWQGVVTITSKKGVKATLLGGESCLISADAQDLQLSLMPYLGEEPRAAVFTLMLDLV